ncbi:hypothetical protein SLA2020_294840 [Shorea laevis]
MEVVESISIPSISDGASASGGQTIESKCECGLTPVLRTALTFQNMGKRFWGCPNFLIGKPCKFFHFIPGDKVIKGRARDLLLRLKDKQLRFQSENERLKKENADLIKENNDLMKERANLIKGNDDLMKENAGLLVENGNLLHENEVLIAESESLVKKIKHLEKKVKRSEKICIRSQKVSIILCVFCMLSVVSAIGLFIGLQRLH